jgi:hypothetical protein
MKKSQARGRIAGLGSSCAALLLLASSGEAALKAYCFKGSPVFDTHHEIRVEVEPTCRKQRPGVRKLSPVAGIFATSRFTDPYQVSLVHGTCDATSEGVVISAHGGAGSFYISGPTLNGPVMAGGSEPLPLVDCESTLYLGAP